VALMSVAVQSAGLSGALLGLVFGALNYVLAMVMMARATRRRLAEDDAPTVGDITARLRPIKTALATMSFLVLPALGFIAGAMLTPGGEAR
jgi:hypothetical protein